MKIIDIRRSIRKYKNTPVEAMKVEKLLRAGMQAPSAGNQQPWEFIVVDAWDDKEKISKMSPYAGSARNAQSIIVVVANQKRLRFEDNMQQDLSACTQNILLEAVEQDLGATWMSAYPQKERMQCLKDVLSLPEYIIPFCIITVGYPEDYEDNKYIDRFDNHKIHYDRYGNRK